MQRKMMGLFAALVAFGAFALVPAISSAHGLLDTKNGVATTVGVGEKIVGFNEVGTAPEFTGGLTIRCPETTMTGTVAANPHTAAGAVQGTIEDVWFRGNEDDTECFSSLGPATITIPGMTNEPAPKTRHWCVRTVAGTDNFNVEPRNCGAVGGEFTFLIHAGGLTCGYTRTANIGGTFTTPTNHTASTLSMTDGQKFTKHVGGFLCPAEGELKNFKFELYTDTGETKTTLTGPTWRDAASVADPIWIT